MLFSVYIRCKQLWHRAGGVRRRVRRALGDPPKRAVRVFPHAIPKRIWMYWDQGEAAAPPLVLRCIRSWREMNPGWSVTVLDATTAPSAVALPALPKTLLPAHYADVLRTRLLAEHGGVWADATTFCARPLDPWLPMVAGQSGFFAFSWIPGDRAFLGGGLSRTIGNWFLASAPGGAVIAAWDRQTVAYWTGRQQTADYFWHNDAFEWVVATDRAARRAWARTPRFGALAPHLAWHRLEAEDLKQHRLEAEDLKQHQLEAEEPTEPRLDAEEAVARAAAVEAAIATGAILVHKFSWRMPQPVSEIEALVAPKRQSLDGAQEA